MASVIYVSADAETHLGQVRAILPDTSGASMIEISFGLFACWRPTVSTAKIIDANSRMPEQLISVLDALNATYPA
jgi:hypothetical protein